MSWSLSLPSVDRAVARKAVTTAYDLYRAGVSAEPETLTAMDEQVSAAIDAVEALLSSGVVGTEGDVHLTLSGHANPGHKPREGYANDFLAVNVASAARRE